MTHCAKCGAELIGQKKFCAACGAPTTDPRAPSTQAAGAAIVNAPPSSSSPLVRGRDSAYGDAPVPSVNPFAQTATPGTQAPVAAYGPPPASKPALSKPDPSPASAQVSPLAVSNVMSQRGAFDAAGGAAVQAALIAQTSTPPEPDPPKKTAGTQVMPSVAKPSQSQPAPSAAGAAPPPTVGKPRTQIMPPSAAVPGSVPKMSSAAPAPVPPSQIARPPVSAQPSVPSPGTPFKPASAPPPYGPAQGPAPSFPQYAPPPPAQTPPQAAPVPGWGWNAGQGAPPYPPSAQPGFAYVPGARVHVTWSNGQRYPGTIQQLAGNQCLVVFPDGRQQWVEMAYVSPA